MQTEKITNFIEDIVLIDSIKRNKNYDKISKLHKYWSRKPWYLIEKSILEYSKEGDLVLLTDSKIYGRNVRSISKQVHEEIIKNLVQFADTE